MIFSILIYGSPTNSLSVESAYRFTKTALAAGHTIHRVFFYGESVYAASSLSVTPRDEVDCFQAWKELAEKHDLDVVVCIAAALKRGVLDPPEAKRHEKLAYNLAPPFSLSGLGQLTDAALTSDRLITFGSA